MIELGDVLLAAGVAVVGYVVYVLFVRVLVFYLRVGNALGWKHTHLLYIPLTGLYKHWNKPGLRDHGDSFYHYRQFRRTHPETKAIVYSNMGNVVLYVLDPELIKEFTLSHQEKCEKTNFPFLDLGPTAGVLLASREHWAQEKKCLREAFKFESLSRLIPTSLEVLSQTLPQYLKQQEEKTIPLMEFCRIIAGEVVMRTFFGPQFKNIRVEGRSPLQLFLQVTNFGNSSRGTMFAIAQLAGKIKSMQKVVGKELNQRMEVFDRVVTDYVQQMIKQESKSPTFLQNFLTRFKARERQMTQTEHKIILNEIKTFLLAGMDTTGTTMATSLVLLSKSPELLQRFMLQTKSTYEVIVGEADAQSKLQAIKNCVFLENFIMQVLRMYNPVKIMLFRKIYQPFLLGPIPLRPGDCFLNFPIAINSTDEQYFKEPMKFNPDRWLDHRPTDDNIYAFIPFSTGPRNCIGQHFSKVELKTTLLKLAHSHKLVDLGKPLRFSMETFYQIADDQMLKIM